MRRRGWLLAALLALNGVVVGAAPRPAPGVTVLGQGPSIVMIHGLGADRASWMPTARTLMKSHRVVLVDLPGHGQTALPEPFSMQAAADVVGRILAREKPENTIVVGQGAGGLVGILALSAGPARARGLALIDVALRFGPNLPEAQREAFVKAFDVNYETMLRQLFGGLGRDSVQGAILHAQAAKVAPTTIRSYLGAALTFDGSKALETLRIPVLYIGSARVWPADTDWAEVAKERGFEPFPNVRARRVGNSAFMIASDQPDTLAAILAEFTARSLRKK